MTDHGNNQRPEDRNMSLGNTEGFVRIDRLALHYRPAPDAGPGLPREDNVLAGNPALFPDISGDGRVDQSAIPVDIPEDPVLALQGLQNDIEHVPVHFLRVGEESLIDSLPDRQLPPRLPQHLVGPLTIRDVAPDADHDAALLPAHLFHDRSVDTEVPHPSVSLDAELDVATGLPKADAVGQLGPAPGRIGIELFQPHQQIGLDHIRAALLEDAAEGLVNHDDLLLRVGSHDAVGRCAQQRVEELDRLPGNLAFVCLPPLTHMDLPSPAAYLCTTLGNSHANVVPRVFRTARHSRRRRNKPRRGRHPPQHPTRPVP